MKKYLKSAARRAGAAATLLLILCLPTPAEAQLFARPYVTGYLGQPNTNFTLGVLGDARQDLEWRRAIAVEGGAELLGMTIGLGLTGIARATWITPQSQEVSLQYRAVYVNVGTREVNGVYFAGGINFALWDEMPAQFINGLPFILEADPEVGFQAYLGLQISLDRLPFRFNLEVGYAQFNGNVIGSGAGDPLSSQVSSTGPIARIGIGLAFPPR